MGLITLFKTWFEVGSSYQARHQSNYTAIENAINSLDVRISGIGGTQQVLQLSLLWDRRGIIGLDSFDFSEGALTAPAYYLTVAAGGYTLGDGLIRYAQLPVLISMAGQPDGTYYINVDASGVPTLGTSQTVDSTRSFVWDLDTFTVSEKTILPAVSILMDGTDYQAMLQSIALGVQYTKVGDRLEAIESESLDIWASYYAQDLPHAGYLEFSYKAGKVRNDSVINDTPAGSVMLADYDTNYIEVDPTDGTVSANQTGFTSGQIPLYQVVTTYQITTVTDVRTTAIAGTGGGGGGHTQGTDVGTTSTDFKIDSDATGTPTGRAGISIENGTNPNAALKYNRDTNRWQWTLDSITWYDIDPPALGDQQFTQYVASEDPPLVHSESNRSDSTDYEDIDFSSYITAPAGVAAVVMRVVYLDTAGDGQVRFRKKGISATPTSFTVYNQNPLRESINAPLMGSVIVLPLDINLEAQFYFYNGGTDSQSMLVYLLGYMKNVTGVGTQNRTLESTGLAVAANTSEDFDITNWMNRGLIHFFEIDETGGLGVDDYDVEIYAKDTFLAADMLYQAQGILPTTAFTDRLPFWCKDEDGTSELHLRIINNDASVAGTFSVTVRAEQFA